MSFHNEGLEDEEDKKESCCKMTPHFATA